MNWKNRFRNLKSITKFDGSTQRVDIVTQTLKNKTTYYYISKTREFGYRFSIYDFFSVNNFFYILTHKLFVSPFFPWIFKIISFSDFSS